MAHVQMDPSYATNTWALLKGAIREIHRANASGLSFEELYRNAYNMVLHKYGDLLYTGLKEVLHEHLSTAVVDSIHLNESFLPDLNRAWTAHKISMLMIRDILMYMDRVYVPHKGDCEPVYDVGLILFRENVARCPRVREHLRKTLLEEIRRERNGEVVNRGDLKAATQMLVDVGVSSTAVYENDFESFFLEASGSFFRNEGQDYIASTSVPVYLKQVELRLREECNRVQYYLDASTKPKIVGVVETELLSAHMPALLGSEETGFVVMLRQHLTDDLSRMYALFARVDGGHKAMMQYLSQYIQDVAMELINSHEQNGKEKETFVEPILELKDKFNQLLKEAFQSDPAFQRTQSQAFEAALNSNRHSPEFLSLFLDGNLKRGLRGVSEDEVEQVINRGIELFRLISEKDVFERYYKQHLARRLLLGKSVSDYAERQVIASLKRECGYQFTSRLEGMFQDMRTSHDTMEAFGRHLTSSGMRLGLDLSVQVLTTGFWPVAQTAQCILPKLVTESCRVFHEFYLARHNGRRLTWQTSMGNADLRANFPLGSVTLNVSTIQMSILVLFNQTTSLALEELAQMTMVDSKDLQRHLLALLRFKVLSKSPAEPRKIIEAGTVFEMNAEFKSKLRRVTVSMGSGSKSTGTERALTDKKVNEDRKLAIQACIVRVMKSRKSATHPQLVAEVMRLLAPRFPPDSAIVKKCIESLLEREYLERSATERKVLNYIA